jgi:Glycosyl transferase family 2
MQASGQVVGQATYVDSDLRNDTPKRPLLAIAAPVRHEARYLLEWIAYHRVLGVPFFFLADNGGRDDTSALLQELHAAGIVFRFDWRGRWGFQTAFYDQILQLAGSAAVDGLFLIDVDEFLKDAAG